MTTAARCVLGIRGKPMTNFAHAECTVCNKRDYCRPLHEDKGGPPCCLTCHRQMVWRARATSHRYSALESPFQLREGVQREVSRTSQ
jgi:hypothetical protein